MDVQSRLRSAEPRLPEEVRRQGILVRKAGSGFLMIVALTSKSGATGNLALGNFAAIGLREAVVVTGFASERIDERLEALGERHGLLLDTVFNPKALEWNNAYSLWCARETFSEGVVLVNGDTIVPSSVPQTLLDAESQRRILDAFGGAAEQVEIVRGGHGDRAEPAQREEVGRPGEEHVAGQRPGAGRGFLAVERRERIVIGGEVRIALADFLADLEQGGMDRAALLDQLLDPLDQRIPLLVLACQLGEPDLDLGLRDLCGLVGLGDQRAGLGDALARGRPGRGLGLGKLLDLVDAELLARRGLQLAGLGLGLLDELLGLLAALLVRLGGVAERQLEAGGRGLEPGREPVWPRASVASAPAPESWSASALSKSPAVKSKRRFSRATWA